jgi:hypothetical protein
MPYSDTGTLSESNQTATRGIFVADVGILAETTTGHSSRTIRETLTVHEQYALHGHPVEMVGEAVQVVEAWTAMRRVLVSDTGTLHEQYTQWRHGRVYDSGHLAEAYSPVARHHVTVAERGHLSERWTGIRSLRTSDTLHAAEALRFRRGLSTSDHGTFGELVIPRANPRFAYSDKGTWAEAYSYTVAPRKATSDELFVDEAWILPGADTQAWTANTDTFAMSRYVNYPFNSLAEIAGVLYGAAADGLYRIDAALDAGTPIDAWVLTGQQDMGSEATKRMRVMYAGATTDGALQVTVRDNSYGAVSYHTFPFEVRRGDDFAPQRAKLGRGMRSRYWQFKVGNVDGADFKIDKLSLVEDTGFRRV